MKILRNNMCGRIVTNDNKPSTYNPPHTFEVFIRINTMCECQIGYSCFSWNFIVLLLSIMLEFDQVL